MRFSAPLPLFAGLAWLCAPSAFAADSLLLVGPSDAPVFINSVVGTDLLWGAGYFGQGVTIANVEAGHPWSGHEVFDRTALGIAATPAVLVSDPVSVDAPEIGEVDFHATMVAHVLVGARTVTNPDSSVSLTLAGAGMAPLATLWSGAIATHFDKTPENAGSFLTSDSSFRTPYVAFFEGAPHGRAGVINSSWGGDDPSAIGSETRIITGLAAQNPMVTAVFSAGNSGPGINTVGGPGSSFNVISVGALGGPMSLTPSEFSSGGPVDFYNPATDTIIPAVRAAVHVAAPGENFALAAYLQPTGGLEPLLGGFSSPSNNLYFNYNQSGTSFASPLVAGGIGLLKGVIQDPLYGLPQAEALDARVIRSVIMASAVPTEGWNNGQATASDGAVVTTQGLDFQTGAGRFDVGRAALLFVNGTNDAPGLGGGSGFALSGWDFGRIDLGQVNYYALDAAFATEPFEFTVSLNWFVADGFDSTTGTTTYGSFADLDIEVWSLSISGTFETRLAGSLSDYNNTEFLRFAAASGTRIGLRVRFDASVYDLDGTPGGGVDFGLAWVTTPIPEPAAAAVWAGCVVLGVWGFRRRRSGAKRV